MIKLQVSKKTFPKNLNKLPGGLADYRSPEDFDPKQIEKGLKVEMEHTNDPNLALEIVLDHLTEDPLYYDKLAKIEESLSGINLLNEISVEDVLDSISSEKKKFKKKFKHMLVTGIEELQDQPLKATPEQIDDVLTKSFIPIFKEYIQKSTPEDVTPSQAGASANWIKRHILSDLEAFKMTVLGTGEDKLPHDIFKRRLEKFFMVQDFIESPYSKDINTYKDAREIGIATNDALPRYVAHQEKKRYMDAGEGADNIITTDEWKVFIPRNKGAACELGKETQWCTAAPGLDYYEQYHSEEDPLFIFINRAKPEEKYQLHFGTNQFMDKTDSSMPTDLFKKFVKILKDHNQIPPKIEENLVTWDDGTVSIKKSDGEGQARRDAFFLFGPYGSHGEIYHRLDGPAEIIYNVVNSLKHLTDDKLEFVYLMKWFKEGEKLGEVWVRFHDDVEGKYLYGGDAMSKLYFCSSAEFNLRTYGEYGELVAEIPHTLELQRWDTDLVSTSEEMIKWLKDKVEKINNFPKIKEFNDKMVEKLNKNYLELSEEKCVPKKIQIKVKI